MSTVSFAGFSRVNGALKFRTANDTKRIDQLRKLGDTDVVILALPSAMTKNDAAKFVLANLAGGEYFVDVAEAEALLTSTIKDENPFAKPKTVKQATVKVTQAKVKKADAKVADYDFKMSSKEAAKVRAQFMKQLKEVYEAN